MTLSTLTRPPTATDAAIAPAPRSLQLPASIATSEGVIIPLWQSPHCYRFIRQYGPSHRCLGVAQFHLDSQCWHITQLRQHSITGVTVASVQQVIRFLLLRWVKPQDCKSLIELCLGDVWIGSIQRDSTGNWSATELLMNDRPSFPSPEKAAAYCLQHFDQAYPFLW